MHSKKIVGIDWGPAPERPSIIPLHAAAMCSPEPAQITIRHPGTGEDVLPFTSGTSERNQTTLLPRYDTKTNRCEFAVFLGLGLTALALIGSTLLESGRFAENRDAITAVLVSGQLDSTQLACCPTNHGATNVTVIPAAARSERAS
ncbi:MAG TPA: hypothetical protein VNZ64_18920 [Candidatus Acidoferrum sp.]|jgi:hypothetical protein|nr:hypothetical protein [Candidatus Acidoferrum sp.]